MGYKLSTTRGYEFGAVTSALQKAIRRGDARLGGYWAVELFESGYGDYAWRRLLTISAEDCWGIITKEVEALRSGYLAVNQRRKKGELPKGRIFIAKAVILLAQAKKSRDADHLTNFVYDAKAIPDAELERNLDESRKDREEIPDYAYDCHTSEGRRRGKTKADFFRDEYAALEPREAGLFDGLIDEGQTQA